MADSETNTQLPLVSRRTVLGGGIASPLFPVSGAKMFESSGDTILRLWTEWQGVACEAAAWGTRWAALEAELARTVGFPRVQVPTAPGKTAVWVTSHAQIDCELKDSRETEELRNRLHADLVLAQTRWNEAAARVDLDSADRHEEAAMTRSAELAETLFTLPAQGIPGVIVKLELIVRMGQIQADDEDFPWKWLQTAVADLKRLAAKAGVPTPV